MEHAEDPRENRNSCSCHDDNVEALNCDWDVEVMQFLIDSFICMFPEPTCGDHEQECCYTKDGKVGGNCCYGSEAPGFGTSPPNNNYLFQAVTDQYNLDKKYTFEVQDEDDNDGILENGADAFGCTYFCHAMGP